MPSLDPGGTWQKMPSCRAECALSSGAMALTVARAVRFHAAVHVIALGGEERCHAMCPLLCDVAETVDNAQQGLEWHLWATHIVIFSSTC